MIIKSIELSHFRNYNKQVIAFGEGINLLFGQNAQGKTNVLEALYIAATGKSHRSNNYNDLIQYGQTGFEIKLEALIDQRPTDIVIKYAKEKGRYAEINGIKRSKLSDILGTLNMILFSPETLDVVKGSPAERRKFIDVLLCQTNRQYLHNLQQYNGIIKNKSLALKKSSGEQKYKDVIPVWNEQLAQFGSRIAYTRMKTIERLNQYMQHEIHHISSGKELSQLIYKTFCPMDASFGPEDFEEALRQKLDKNMAKEMALSQCLYGTHRDDFEILLNDMNSRQYCSQGQQRSLALALIISELLFVESIRGEKPVLLLDDVMSELDTKRQEYLLEGLYDVQTLITATDDVPYSGIKGKAVTRFFVENGCVSLKS